MDVNTSTFRSNVLFLYLFLTKKMQTKKETKYDIPLVQVLQYKLMDANNSLNLL